MSSTQSDVSPGEPITVTIGTTVEVSAAHGANWFPLHIASGLHSTTVYLRRAQLHALRCRLDEIDDGMPPVEGES